LIAAAALLAAMAMANAKDPGNERTFHWFKEQPPGRVSRPGSYVAATAIWASRSDARCALPSTARDKKPNRERN
jgi:hypothetical protein